jgi:hypothetical protein
MTTIRLSTIGWSIDQWNSLQCSLQPEDALQNIIDLVSTFDSNDPAWITIASKELLKSQWEALPTDGKVSIYVRQCVEAAYTNSFSLFPCMVFRLR